MAKFLWVLSSLMFCGNIAHASTNVQIAAGVDRPPDTETIASLRARGPDGLQQALLVYDGLVKARERLQRRLDQMNGAGAGGRKESIARVDKEMAAWHAA